MPARQESQSAASLFVILVQKEVCDWLLQHVAKADMEYARFLRQRVPDAGSQSGRQFSRA
jgi:hemerythrin